MIRHYSIRSYWTLVWKEVHTYRMIPDVDPCPHVSQLPRHLLLKLHHLRPVLHVTWSVGRLANRSFSPNSTALSFMPHDQTGGYSYLAPLSLYSFTYPCVIHQMFHGCVEVCYFCSIQHVRVPYTNSFLVTWSLRATSFTRSKPYIFSSWATCSLRYISSAPLMLFVQGIYLNICTVNIVSAG